MISRERGEKVRWFISASASNTIAPICLVCAIALTGCGTSKDELMTHSDETMADIWRGRGSHSPGDNLSQQALYDARSLLSRPMSDADVVGKDGYTRTAGNEIYSQFGRLENPDLIMYIFPHLAGKTGGELVPIPGYSTVFPLFSKPLYAMPGESARPSGRSD